MGKRESEGQQGNALMKRIYQFMHAFGGNPLVALSDMSRRENQHCCSPRSQFSHSAHGQLFGLSFSDR